MVKNKSRKDQKIKNDIEINSTGDKKKVVIDEAISAIREAINSAEKIDSLGNAKDINKSKEKKEKPVLVLDKIIINNKLDSYHNKNSKKEKQYKETNEFISNTVNSSSKEKKIEEMQPEMILQNTVIRELKIPLEEWIRNNLKTIVRETVASEIDIIKSSSNKSRIK